MKQYWLVKSEPDVYSIEHLKKDGSTGWSGVRNYQARNYMRDSMKAGDGVLFYHSNAEPKVIAGIARVSRESHPDPTQFDARSEFFDAKSTPEKPTWMMVEIQFERAFARPVTLEALKKDARLKAMVLLQRGSRLSVQPVTAGEWDAVLKMAEKA